MELGSRPIADGNPCMGGAEEDLYSMTTCLMLITTCCVGRHCLKERRRLKRGLVDAIASVPHPAWQDAKVPPNRGMTANVVCYLVQRGVLRSGLNGDR